MSLPPVPPLRLRDCNAAPIRAGGDLVLYWMIAYRRPTWNFSLQHAAATAERLGKPLVILEALRCNYRWASDRLHRFVIDGMADNARALARGASCYYPYVEPARSAGMGLLEALANRACIVVTDDFPCFFLPGMVRRVAAAVDVRVTAVDSNGLLPMRAATEVYPTAYAFRRFLQRTLPVHLVEPPVEDPLRRLKLPPIGTGLDQIRRRWPAADFSADEGPRLGELPIDHDVAAAPVRGGSAAGSRRLRDFLASGIDRYAEDRNKPGEDASSGLSPYLHFGHVSVHEIFAGLVDREEWTPDRLGRRAAGKREGWWGMEAVEGFLDELVTWRELGFNMCQLRDDYDRYESLPGWARATLEKHAGDPRAHVYSLEQFENAATHDSLWNAAQRQIVREGRMHNYLRMLWGKKILEWSATPREALATMIHLNNKYGLDGRNPNSYTGIFWVLGRYDRPWGPERPIFGTVRYMSSENTARKFDVKGYLARYA